MKVLKPFFSLSNNSQIKIKNKDVNNREDYLIELLDRVGERRFVKTKLETQANTFLSDKNTYILC
jgi:hypothetical protein